jgi:GxxExxY protein
LQKLPHRNIERSIGAAILTGSLFEYASGMVSLLHGALTEQILGGFFEVHGEMGYGFMEGVYRPPLIYVLRGRGLEVEENARLPVYFRGRLVAAFCPDLVVNQLVIVELKAVRAIEPMHQAQLLNYLKASDFEVGLLLNFGPKPEFKRFLFDNSRKASRPTPGIAGVEPV